MAMRDPAAVRRHVREPSGTLSPNRRQVQSGKGGPPATAAPPDEKTAAANAALKVSDALFIASLLCDTCDDTPMRPDAQARLKIARLKIADLKTADLKTADLKTALPCP